MARSTAKTPRDLVGSDKHVQKVSDLVRVFDVPYFMENPHSGLLKTRNFVNGIPMRVIDYCQYADDEWPGRYRKRTSIWTSTDWIPARPLCIPSTSHFCTDGKKHDQGAQRRTTEGKSQHTLHQLYSIPSALPEELVNWLRTNLALNEE
jgi:hypothetical protein